MRELTKDEIVKVLGLVAAGHIVGVGEYRSCSVEVKEFEDFDDKSKRVQKAVISHSIDFGASCERRKFGEILDDAAKAKTFTAPAKSGDLVAVTVSEVRKFRGDTSFKGSVVKL